MSTSIQGSVNLTTSEAVNALKALSKATRSATDAGEDLTAQQRLLVNSASDAAAKILKANREAAESYAEIQQAAIVTEEKLRQMRIKGVNDRSNSNQAAEDKREQTAALAAERLRTAEAETLLRQNRANTEALRGQTAELNKQAALYKARNGVQDYNAFGIDTSQTKSADTKYPEAGADFAKGLQQRLENEVKAETAAIKEAERATDDWAEAWRRLERAQAQDAGQDAKEYNRQMEARIAATNAAAAAEERANDQRYSHLAETRYALYDVSRGLAVTSAALLALAIAPVAVATAWEKDFAQVRRVTDGTTEDIDRLQDGLLGLVQSIPINWSAATQIATLAGQMGIASDQAVSFTAAVAKFTATSDVSVEDAATAFGRLNTLLPDVKGNYEGLGDSILKVGVNSVATESSIVRITTQIAAIAGPAGFSSQEIIGLSGALASVAVPPELARGVLTRVFGDISKAASDGGVKLNGFARLAGMSAEEFKTAWSQDTANTFNAILHGIDNAGGAAQATLNSIGITSVRDVPVLIRLASALDSAGQKGELFTQTMADAKNASGELARQYEIVSSTISGQLQILQNSFEGFLAAAGEGSLGPLGIAIGLLNDNLREMTKFLNTDAGQAVAGFSILIAGILGILAAIGAAAATGIAGLIALTIALRNLQGQATNTAISYGGLLAMLRETGPMGAKAATGIGLIGKAAGIAAAAMALLILPDVFRGTEQFALKIAGSSDLESLVGILNKVGDSADYVTEHLNGQNVVVQKADSVLGKYIANTSKGTQEINRAFANVGLGGINDWINGFYGTGTAVTVAAKQVDDKMADLVRSGNVRAVIESFDSLAQTSGVSFEQLLNGGSFPELRAQLKESGIEVKTLSDGTLQYSNQLGVTSTDISDFTGELTEAEKVQADFEKTLSDGRNSFISFSDALTTATDDAGAFHFDQFIGGLQEQINAQETWSQSMLAISGKVSAGLLGELAKLGPEGLPLIQALTTAAPEELAVMEDAFKRAGEESGAAFATAVVGIQGALAGIARVKGQEAADALAAGLLDPASGTTVESIVAEWNSLQVTIPADANTEVADTELNSTANAERRAKILAYADKGGIDQVNKDLGPNGGVTGTRPSNIKPYVDGGSRDTANRELNDVAQERTARVRAQAVEDSIIGTRSYIQGMFAQPLEQKVNVSYSGGGVGGTRGYTGGRIGSLEGNIPHYAGGGKLPGPRQPQRTTDNILMWGRSNEYLVNEQATNLYGEKFLDAVNNRSLDFANFAIPVPMAPASSTTSGPSTVVSELSPYDRQLLREIAARTGVTIAPSDVAAAANAGNKSNFQKGGTGSGT